MISSPRCKVDSEMGRPSALASLRLTTRVQCAGCSIGSSAGLAANWLAALHSNPTGKRLSVVKEQGILAHVQCLRCARFAVEGPDLKLIRISCAREAQFDPQGSAAAFMSSTAFGCQVCLDSQNCYPNEAWYHLFEQLYRLAIRSAVITESPVTLPPGCASVAV
jgi:hypothetical protein